MSYKIKMINEHSQTFEIHVLLLNYPLPVNTRNQSNVNMIYLFNLITKRNQNLFILTKINNLNNLKEFYFGFFKSKS